MRLYNWDDLDSIIFELKLGKVGVVATDTLSGLISLSAEAIYKIKRRSHKKKLILFINDLSQIAESLPEDLLALVKNFWPGKLTIVYKKKSYRMPNVPAILNLINYVGPLHSSSANISGEKVITSFSEIETCFHQVMNELIVINSNQWKSPSQLGSTVYDYDNKKIIRFGDVAVNQIEKYVPIKN